MIMNILSIFSVGLFMIIIVVSLYQLCMFFCTGNHILNIIYNFVGYEYAYLNQDCEILTNLIIVKGKKYTKDNLIELLKALKQASTCTIMINSINTEYKCSKYFCYKYLVSTKYIIPQIETLIKKHTTNQIILNAQLPQMFIKNKLYKDKYILFNYVEFEKSESNLLEIIELNYKNLATCFLNGTLYSSYARRQFEKYNIYVNSVSIEYTFMLPITWKNLNKKSKKQKVNNSTQKKVMIQNQDSQDVEINNLKIKNLILSIDEKIANGYKFKSISIETWTHTYKSSILNLYKTTSKLDKENEEKIISILNSLNTDMYDKKIEELKQDQGATISALESKLFLDGIKELPLV